MNSTIGTMLISTLFLSSCAGIKYQKKLSTDSTINHFKKDTEVMQLDRVVQTQSPAPEVKFLKNINDKKFDFWVNYFTKRDKRSLEVFIKNGSNYKKIVQDIFKKYNLPTDLYYVGMIESGYKSRARSHAGAVGYWQFISETGRRYGLKINKNIDERQNIYKSTVAAAKFFKELYNIFGSWELALAAYNAGEFGIIRRIRKAGTRDYYELSRTKAIPKETRHYIPKVRAVAYLHKNHQKYGIRNRSDNAKFYNDTIPYRVTKSINISKFARKLGINTKDVRKLNQDLRSNWLNVGKSGIILHLPNKSKLNFSKAQRYIASQKARRRVESISIPRFHKVGKNENLSSISKKYNLKISTIKAINSLRGSNIYIGQKLNLHVDKSIFSKQISRTRNKEETHRVKSGENLTSVARKYLTSVTNLKLINKLKSNRIYIGQKIRVPYRAKTFYTVKSGDILSRIAMHHKTTISKLKALNSLRGSGIWPGQKLVVSIRRI